MSLDLMSLDKMILCEHFEFVCTYCLSFTGVGVFGRKIKDWVNCWAL